MSSPSPFTKIAKLIKKLNVDDDSIVLDRNLKSVLEDFSDIVQEDDHMLSDGISYFNQRALNDGEFAINFAMLFTANRPLETLSFTSKQIRTAMVQILHENYTNAAEMRQANIQQLHNSITLLGEYYNRVRIDGKPLVILGQSLFELLTKELLAEMSNCNQNSEHTANIQLSRLVLSQITLNGALAKPNHQTDIEKLLFAIRKCLIDVPNLPQHFKVFLLMTMDLYYSNFTSIGAQIEDLYASTLLKYDREEETRQKKLVKDFECDEKTMGVDLVTQTVKSIVLNANSTILKNRESRPKINEEYLARPLKASERLKYMQRQGQLDETSNRQPNESSNKSDGDEFSGNNKLDVASSSQTIESTSVGGDSKGNLELDEVSDLWTDESLVTLNKSELGSQILSTEEHATDEELKTEQSADFLIEGIETHERLTNNVKEAPPDDIYNEPNYSENVEYIANSNSPQFDPCFNGLLQNDTSGPSINQYIDYNNQVENAGLFSPYSQINKYDYSKSYCRTGNFEPTISTSKCSSQHIYLKGPELRKKSLQRNASLDDTHPKNPAQSGVTTHTSNKRHNQNRRNSSGNTNNVQRKQQQNDYNSNGNRYNNHFNGQRNKYYYMNGGNNKQNYQQRDNQYFNVNKPVTNQQYNSGQKFNDQPRINHHQHQPRKENMRNGPNNRIQDNRIPNKLPERENIRNGQNKNSIQNRIQNKRISNKVPEVKHDNRNTSPTTIQSFSQFIEEK